MKIENLYETDSKSIKTFLQKSMVGRGRLFLKKTRDMSSKVDVNGVIDSVSGVIGDNWDDEQETLYKMLRRVIISNNVGVIIGRPSSDTSDFSESEIIRLKAWYMKHKDMVTEDSARKSLWASILLAFLNGLGIALGVRKVVTTLGATGVVQTVITLQQFIVHLNTLFKKIYNGQNLKHAIRLIDRAIDKYKTTKHAELNDENQ